MTYKFISAVAFSAAALLTALGPANAQTSGSQDKTTPSTDMSRPSAAQPGTSGSGSVQGSVTNDSPSASPRMAPDQESAKARGVERPAEAARATGEPRRDKPIEEERR